jgi:hypothetical protein
MSSHPLWVKVPSTQRDRPPSRRVIVAVAARSKPASHRPRPNIKEDTCDQRVIVVEETAERLHASHRPHPNIKEDTCDQ